jgi:predicted small secreted protein
VRRLIIVVVAAWTVATGLAACASTGKGPGPDVTASPTAEDHSATTRQIVAAGIADRITHVLGPRARGCSYWVEVWRDSNHETDAVDAQCQGMDTPISFGVVAGQPFATADGAPLTQAQVNLVNDLAFRWKVAHPKQTNR